MNQAYLLRTAKELVQPGVFSAREFESLAPRLAEELNCRMTTRADIEDLVGKGNLVMMQDNSRNFCRFMMSLFCHYEPELLVQTVLWVFRTYRAHGFTPQYWPANLDTFTTLAKEALSENAFQEIFPFLNWLIINVPSFVKISDDQLTAPPGAAGHDAIDMNKRKPNHS